MDLSYSPQEERFRTELRSWIEQHPPGPEPEQMDTWVTYGKRWQRMLYEAGWCGVAWPKEYAGKLKVVKMNVDDNPQTPSKYGVRGIPNLILFKGGQVRDQIVGAVPKAHLVKAVSQVV